MAVTVYTLYRGFGQDQWEPIGFYDSMPEAVCALEDERRKEDGRAYRIEKEGPDGGDARNGRATMKEKNV